LTELNAGNHAAYLLRVILCAVQVHARNKSVDPTINWQEVARAMSGFTGGTSERLFLVLRSHVCCN
jgi:hypothetical protein